MTTLAALAGGPHTLRPMENFDVVIVGAGAAGLFCAGVAGQRGLKVLVLGEEGQAPAVQDADFVWLLPSQDGDGVALAPAAASCDAPLQPALH